MLATSSRAATAARPTAPVAASSTRRTSWQPSRRPSHGQPPAEALAAAAVRRQWRQRQQSRPSLMPARAEQDSSSAGSGGSTMTAADLEQRLKELDKLLVSA